MGRLEEHTPDGPALARVFLTPSLREAFRVEELLTMRGVDYVVRVEHCGTTLFGSPRNGAAFYVSPGQADYCSSMLTEAGLELGVLMAQETDRS